MVLFDGKAVRRVGADAVRCEREAVREEGGVGRGVMVEERGVGRALDLGLWADQLFVGGCQLPELGLENCDAHALPRIA